MINGFKYQGVLPEWADDRRQLVVSKGALFLLHPDHPVHRLNEKTKEFEPYGN